MSFGVEFVVKVACWQTVDKFNERNQDQNQEIRWLETGVCRDQNLMDDDEAKPVTLAIWLFWCEML